MMVILASKGQVQWGNVSTWLSAVGSLAAVIVALSLAVARSHRDRSREERDQAEMIAGWLDVGEFQGEECVRLLVRNSSQAAVTRIVAKIRDVTTPSADVSSVEINGIPPTAEPVVRRVAAPFPSPGYQYELISLEFSDYRDTRWTLSTRDGLKRSQGT